MAEQRKDGPVTLPDVAKLFAWLKSQYGAAWTIEATPENLQAWHEQLRPYSLADLRRVCRQLRTEGADFAPSGPKFARMCKGSIYDQRIRAERWNPPLPAPGKDLALNRRRVEELRSRMNLPRPADFDERVRQQRDAKTRLREFLDSAPRVEVSR